MKSQKDKTYSFDEVNKSFKENGTVTVNLFLSLATNNNLCNIRYGNVHINIFHFLAITNNVALGHTPKITLSSLINSPDSLGNTPLTYAMIHQNIECAKIVMQQAASLTQTNKLGLSPLDYLLESGDDKFKREIFKYMFEIYGEEKIFRDIGFGKKLRNKAWNIAHSLATSAILGAGIGTICAIASSLLFEGALIMRLEIIFACTITGLIFGFLAAINKSNHTELKSAYNLRKEVKSWEEKITDQKSFVGHKGVTLQTA